MAGDDRTIDNLLFVPSEIHDNDSFSANCDVGPKQGMALQKDWATRMDMQEPGGQMTLEEKLATEGVLEAAMGWWIVVGFWAFIARPIFAWIREKGEESK